MSANRMILALLDTEMHMPTLPRWNLDSVYSGFDDAEYNAAKKRITELTGLFQQAVSDEDLKNKNPKGWLLNCIASHDAAFDLYENLESYTYARFSTATTDSDCSKELNNVEEKLLDLKKAQVDFRYGLKSLDGNLLSSIHTDSDLSQSSFFISEQRALAEHMMNREQEDLASELSRSGGDAWSRLHSTVSSTLSAPWEDDKTKTVVELRALAYDADRSVRKKAYDTELSAWKKAEVPIAFALNGVKGFSVSLSKRRHYADPLDIAVTASRISRKTLEALIEAMTQGLPTFRRYLAAKARALGLPKLSFYDIFAPMARGSRVWSYDEAKSFIVDRFSEFSADMADFANKAFTEQWIDAEPREGKVGGAYCTYLPIAKESRILCNFDGSFGAVSTVAHELGHGYHGSIMTGLPNSERDYPMTLAETASIFCESVVFNGAIEQATGDERTAVLEVYLQDSTQVIVDILSRYLFENELFARRADNELSPSDLCNIMTDAQIQTYGDALDKSELHPYMWAAKPHYYSQDLPFYNYPYAFGQLFGLGLYGKYVEEGAAFAQSYRKILEGTGRATANEITKEAGFDIENPTFWESGIRVIERRIDEFERLI